MKKIMLLIVCVMSLMCAKAQTTYYKMFTGGAESGEWVCNSASWLGAWGIEFTTAKLPKAVLTDNGKWIIFQGGMDSGSIRTRFTNILNKDENNPWGARMIIDAPAVARKVVVANLETKQDNIQIYNDATNAYIVSNGDEDGLHIKSGSAFNIHLHDHVGIGTTGFNKQIVPGASLTVSGGVFIGPKNFAGPYDISSKVDKFLLWVQKGIVSENFALVKVADWSDHVFNKEYSLRPLSEVEDFIKEKNHLPDVPSEKEVVENGYNLHDMNKVFLQKIEELTLYVIQQQKEINELKEQLAAKNMK